MTDEAEGTFACPICGMGTPHHHSVTVVEIERYARPAFESYARAYIRNVGQTGLYGIASFDPDTFNARDLVTPGVYRDHEVQVAWNAFREAWMISGRHLRVPPAAPVETPDGYRKLPSHLPPCRCPKLWRDENGDYWCCEPSPLPQSSAATGDEDWCEMGDDGWLTLKLKHPSAATVVDIADLACRHAAKWGDHGPSSISMLVAFGEQLLRSSDVPQTSSGIADVAAERQRQISAEGWTPAHDDEHADNELALAALCYLYAGIYDPGDFPHRYWPWDRSWWKPSDNRRNLVKAGALIAAEIDRLDRASSAVSRPESK